MITTGVDIIELDRISDVLNRWGQRFLHRIYTRDEQTYCRGRIPQLAGRFAAKEAVMKALGTGVRGVGWKEIEILRQRGRRPTIHLNGRARTFANTNGFSDLSVSISHSRDYAVAFVIGEKTLGTKVEQPL